LWLYDFPGQSNRFPAKKNPGRSRGFLRFRKWSRHSSPTQKTPGPGRRVRRRLRRRIFLQAMVVMGHLNRIMNWREYGKWPEACQAKTAAEISGSQIQPAEIWLTS
jgi:hypothetical protein